MECPVLAASAQRELQLFLLYRLFLLLCLRKIYNKNWQGYIASILCSPCCYLCIAYLPLFPQPQSILSSNSVRLFRRAISAWKGGISAFKHEKLNRKKNHLGAY